MRLPLLIQTLAVAAWLAHPALPQQVNPLQRLAALRAELADPAREEPAVEGLLQLALDLGPRIDTGRAAREDLYAFTTVVTLLVGRGAAAPLGAPQALLDRARAAADLAQIPESAASVELTRARLHYEAGDLAGAEDTVRRALEEIGGAAPVNELNLRSLLVELLRKRQEWVAALEEVQRALDALEERREMIVATYGSEAAWHQSRAGLLGAWGMVLRRLGVPDQAALLFEREGEAAERSGQPSSLGAHRLHRIDLLLMTERHEDALAVSREARGSTWFGRLRTSEALSFDLAEGVALSELGRDEARADGVLEASAARLTALLDDPAATEVHRLSARLTLADLALRAGELERAAPMLAAARSLVDGVSDPGPILHERAWLTAHETRLALARASRGADGESAEELLEARRSMDRAFGDLLSSWARTPVRPGGIGFLHLGNRRQVVSALLRVVLATEPPSRAAEVALERLLAAQDQGSMARHTGSGPASLEAIRAELLGAGHGALVFLPSKERTHLFVLDDDGTEHIELPSHGDLRGAALPLLATLAAPPPRGEGREAYRERVVQGAASLGHLLLPPRARARTADWRAVTLVGLDLLGDPPLELVELEGRGRLGWVLATDRLPSLALGVHLLRRGMPTRAPGDPELALLANLEPAEPLRGRSPTVASIPLDLREIRRLHAAYPPDSVTALLGPDLHRAALARLDLAHVAVSHWLVHGHYDRSRERGASLLLAADPAVDGDDGVFACEDVERLEVAGLVVLDACGASRGPVRIGDDGLGHLGGAFLRAGARCVMLSGARLEYQATLDLSAAFHDALRAAGRSPAEALRVARGELGRRGDPVLQFAETPFFIVGAGQASLED